MQESISTIPSEFICPILQTVMEDPVLTIDGFTYDRIAITEWFSKGNQTSPLTGIPLSSQQLIPVKGLKSLIEAFKKANGLKNGYGVQYWLDGGRYEGHYKDGRRHGKGIEYWSDGGSFEGEFLNGRRQGKGIQHWSDGGMFEGQFSNGKRSGYGIERWSDGGHFKGEYADGMRNGNGTEEYVDGSQFEGYFKNGKKHGKGVFKSNYEEQQIWENGKKISN